MRVPNLSMYSNSTYRLGSLTSDLQKANEVMATQKRINSISDDPIGISQVLGLGTCIENLEQIETNVNMGKSWLDSSENALDSTNDLILEAKTHVSQLINASMSSDERQDAVESINGIIEQIIDLGNSQINGNYIFSGTDTNILPLEYHDDDDLPWVSYNGNSTPFSIKTDENATVQLGNIGSKIFWDDEVDINSTNNTIIFKEDNGHGSASQIVLKATIDDGTYTTAELETVVRNALNKASFEEGYKVAYEVEYNKDEQTFSIREDGSYDGFIQTEFMWETGSDAYLTGISAGSSIDPNDINVTVDNPEALTIDTSEPFRLTWQGDGTWAIDNNPGYIIIGSSISGSDDSIGIDLNESGSADITITLDNPVTTTGQYIEFDIVSAQGDHSIGNEIGFNGENSIYAPPTSDTNSIFVTDLLITAGVNDTIEFVEVDSTGTPTGTLVATIANDTYTDMDDLAAEIEAKMEAASVINGIDYAVSYDAQEGKFNIREDGSSLNELQILWSNTGVTSETAATLGYYANDSIAYPSSEYDSEWSITSDEAVVNITIDEGNNKINFTEILKGSDGTDVDELTAQIEIEPGGKKTYTSLSQLALDVEKALEEESYQNGNRIDYSVTWDADTNHFTIKENGTELAEFNLLWETGKDAPVSEGGTGESIGEILGFDTQDDNAAPVESDRKVEWGIFNTLIDLNQYLSDNDVDGLERTLGRLEAQYENMTSEIVGVGTQYNRLEIREQITSEVNLSLTERKSTIEDVDIIEATMNLQSINTAYEAALSSTASILKLSLVDYL